MPELTVIIVNYNAGDELKRALQSVAAECAGLDWDAVVVDNASTDGSAACVTDFSPRVTLAQNAENVGFGRAVNQAMAVSRAPLLLVINPDCQLRAGALVGPAGRAGRGAVVRGRRTSDSRSRRRYSGKRTRRSGHADRNLRPHWRTPCAASVHAGGEAERRGGGGPRERGGERGRRLGVWCLHVDSRGRAAGRRRVRRAATSSTGRMPMSAGGCASTAITSAMFRRVSRCTLSAAPAARHARRRSAPFTPARIAITPLTSRRERSAPGVFSRAHC